MKKIISFRFFFVCVSLTASHFLFSQRDDSGKDKTRSPYFEVSAPRGDKETLPLLSTSANVNIAGVIASVKVTQVYVNRGKNPIEASYVFPLSTRAAVYSMQFVLGKRTVKAEIKEKEEAQKTYNEAKAKGKTAALLQQHRANVFQMNLSNIMPGDTIRVEMNYTELLTSENNVYEFVYPTVVGPRYTSDTTANGKPSEQWLQTSYTGEGKDPTYLFDIKTSINAGIPLHDVACSSHEVDMKFNGNNSAQIDLKNTDRVRGNKDFILHYRLTGDKVQEGLLLYEDENRQGYFLMMMQPPKAVSIVDLPAREYFFIMDVSGSQSGFPLEVSKELMKNLLGSLRPKDVFNVMIFEGRAGFMSEKSMKADTGNIRKAVEFVDKQSAGGGTEMLKAIQKAMTFPKTEGYSRTFAISTDGYISMEAGVFDYIKNNLGEANFFAFGIGSSVNRLIIEGIAHAGMGEQFVVTKKEEASATAEKFKTYISNPVLTNIKVNYEGFEVSDLVPQNVPDVFALRPIVIFGKYKGNPAGTIKVSGINASGKYLKTINVGSEKAQKENAALKYLWARHKIRGYELDGKIRNDRKKEITQLGLEYGLLTQYTSFVAVDSEVRNKGGKQDSVAQPLPLPEGVTENATMYFSSAKKQVAYKVLREEVANEKMQVKVMADRLEKKQEVIQEKQVLVVEQKKSQPVEANDIKKESVIRIADTTRVEQEEIPMDTPDVMPEFPGGEEAMQAFIKKEMKYPKSAKDSKIQETIYVQFVIGKDGTVKSVVLKKGTNAELVAEALRIVKLMPKWKPGQSNGKIVAVRCNLPIKFKL